MDKKILDQICQKIYDQFPLVKDVIPEIRSQPHDQILLIFKGSGATEDGHPIDIIVRAVSDQIGRILKTTVSR